MRIPYRFDWRLFLGVISVFLGFAIFMTGICAIAYFTIGLGNLHWVWIPAALIGLVWGCTTKIETGGDK
jgi:hypothetical protein